MNYISLCDGIGAAHVAWQPLGWKCLGVSEIDPFCNRVIEHHWGFENLGALDDYTTLRRIEQAKPDIIIGGTPCQSFSVAGARQGVEASNGQLVLWFLQAVYRAEPRYFIWENVPGVYSTDKGAVFHALVRSFAAIGYVVEWATFDAQYFGVPQRRRRVFLVGRPGGECGRTLFPAREGSNGNSQKNRGKGSYDRCTASEGLGDRSQLSQRYDSDNTVCDTVTAKWAKGSSGPSGDECQNLVAIPLQDVNQRTGVSTSDRSFGIGIGGNGDPMYTLLSGSHHGVADAKAGNNAGMVRPVFEGLRVRRLVPVEAERLQGLPDDYTLVPVKTYKNGRVEMSSDSKRYKAIGNSMAVPVIRWIGEQIENFERES